MITPKMQPDLYRKIREKCRDLGVLVHALNGVSDHVHLVCSVPPTLALSEVAQGVKGSSSFHINHMIPSPGHLDWQEGYNALTFRGSELAVVTLYVDRQAERHARDKLSLTLERCGDEFEPSPAAANVIRETPSAGYMSSADDWDIPRLDDIAEQSFKASRS